MQPIFVRCVERCFSDSWITLLITSYRKIRTDFRFTRSPGLVRCTRILRETAGGDWAANPLSRHEQTSAFSRSIFVSVLISQHTDNIPDLSLRETGMLQGVGGMRGAKNNPKVVRQGLRLAFLPPGLTKAALAGEATFELKRIPKLLLLWGFSEVGTYNGHVCFAPKSGHR